MRYFLPLALLDENTKYQLKKFVELLTLCFIFCMQKMVFPFSRLCLKKSSTHKPWTKSLLFQCTRFGQTITAVNVIYYCRRGFLENTCTVKERMNTVSPTLIFGGVVFLVLFHWSETDNMRSKSREITSFLSLSFIKGRIHMYNLPYIWKDKLHVHVHTYMCRQRL